MSRFPQFAHKQTAAFRWQILTPSSHIDSKPECISLHHPAAQDPSYSSSTLFSALHYICDDLSSLPGLSGLQLLPALYGTSLHADHVLVSVSGAEVWHVGAVRPGVPDDHLVEVISSDAELGLAAFSNDNGLTGPADGSVDAVNLGGDAEGRGGGSVGGDGRGEFVHIR
jgi:hypothetical protein